MRTNVHISTVGATHESNAPASNCARPNFVLAQSQTKEQRKMKLKTGEFRPKNQQS